MSGNIIAAARRDIQKITATGGFNEKIIIESPDGSLTADVQGLTTGVWEQYDPEGQKVNSSKSHCSFTEISLIELGYVTRNQKGRVALNDHKITLIDPVTGDNKTFKITEAHPNSTLGIIVCLLGNLT